MVAWLSAAYAISLDNWVGASSINRQQRKLVPMSDASQDRHPVSMDTEYVTFVPTTHATPT